MTATIIYGNHFSLEGLQCVSYLPATLRFENKSLRFVNLMIESWIRCDRRQSLASHRCNQSFFLLIRRNNDAVFVHKKSARVYICGMSKHIIIMKRRNMKKCSLCHFIDKMHRIWRDDNFYPPAYRLISLPYGTFSNIFPSKTTTITLQNPPIIT